MREALRGSGRRTSTPLILLVALAVRVAAWLVGLASPDSFFGGDSPGYWALAGDPIEYYVEPGPGELELSLLRPPLYPLILSAFRLLPGGAETAALAQIGFGVACVWLTILVGKELFGSGVAAALAGWWVALDPLHVVESSILLTEIPFSVALLGAIMAASRATRAPGRGTVWWMLAGLLVAVATLIRPITAYIPVLVLIAIAAWGIRVGWKDALRYSLTFLLAAAIPIGSWVVRNYALTGVSTVSTIQGKNLAHYRAVGALVEDTGLTVREARALIDDQLEDRIAEMTNPAEISAEEAELGMEIITSHPVGYAVSALKGLFRTLIGPGGSHISDRTQNLAAGSSIALIFTAISAVSAIAATTLSLAGAWLLLRLRNIRPLVLLGVPLVYLWLIGSGFESYSRFRLQFFPILALMGAYAVAGFIDGQKSAAFFNLLTGRSMTSLTDSNGLAAQHTASDSRVMARPELSIAGRRSSAYPVLGSRENQLVRHCSLFLWWVRIADGRSCLWAVLPHR